MNIEFGEQYLLDLYEKGVCSDKKHRYQPEIIKAYRRCIDKLLSAPTLETLYNIHSLNYEVLTGDKKGICSVRINSKYRLEFKIQSAHESQILTICFILDITNHYQ